MSHSLRTLFLCSGLFSATIAPPVRATEPPHRNSSSESPGSAQPPSAAGALFITYCAPTYLEGCNAGTTSLALADFQLEGTTLDHRNTGCSDKGYGDFTGMTTTLKLGQAYTFVARTAFSIGDGGNPSFIPQRVSIWLDANHDGTFAPEERIYPAPNASGDIMDPALRKELTVPASAKKGITRMRVRTREAAEEYDDPCWNYFYGETHDYTVNLADPNQPDTPVGAICLDLKVLMEGPYLETSSAMRTVLNQRGLLPGQTPVGPLGTKTLPATQPYNREPWNYAGKDSVTTYDADVVDWVLVSLRTAPDSTKPVFRGAGLLRSDGRVTMVTACPVLATDKSYYAVVEHRNHLGVMSPSALSMSGGKLGYDFTKQQSYVKTDPPTAGQLQVGGKFMMFAADAAKSPKVQNFDINYNDSNLWRSESGLFDRYLRGDFNLDADVNFADQLFWKKNTGSYSGIPQ